MLLHLHDQFLLGSDLLVAPILIPGADSRNVLLPGGEAWVNAYTGRTFHAEKPLSIIASAPLGKPPLFLRRDAPSLRKGGPLDSLIGLLDKS